MPEPSRALEDGQWAALVPVAAILAIDAIVQVHGVGVPDVRPEPADTFHVFHRSAVEMLAAVVLLVDRLAQVGVQPHPLAASKIS